MNKDLLNILSESEDDIDIQKLSDYLDGKLSDKDKYEFEKQIADNDFVNDAIEGLQNIPDKKDIESSVEQLNAVLKKQLEKKKRRLEKRRLKEYPWIYISIILILILCIVAYIVIRKALHLF
jgi:hypothetical protein